MEGVDGVSTISESLKTFKSPSEKIGLGFWIYIMTDCLVFATLFATYAVLKNSTNGSVSGKEIFDLPYILVETILLLISSLTAGLMLLFAKYDNKNRALIFLSITLVLGVSFLSMEVHEFSKLVADGHGWQTSAFLSSYFTLVGTHGLHILIGLIWAAVLIGLIVENGLNKVIYKRLMLFSLFWHFLDIVWIFIFSVVYLAGAGS